MSTSRPIEIPEQPSEAKCGVVEHRNGWVWVFSSSDLLTQFAPNATSVTALVRDAADKG